MRIAISNDHAGFPLKPLIVDAVARLGHDVIDVGTADATAVDFPLMTRRVTDLVTSGRADRGVLVCGTGVGAAIAANKVPGIRAAVIHDTHVARQGVEHDDVNVACLGAWIVGPRIAEDAVAAYLAARFSTDPDFRRRVEQLADMERAARAGRAGLGGGDAPGGTP
ncbi:RpiB/LacA/LacB family sugar-phosphate isomerase [Streptomyces radicis]|uniref:RpiB/LacA/LacB family sugar-phosphate isomerase n=1 Tax=Streptomyces radicis TaxID=1750517 RepID=A0A3A9WC69_9ACTN|nr:RpiB/LacA/LacB family sugar-phosphate isomerase [Streptomyces radicis]RKN10951.1 RpiB/LacA/LacB family sugar-phosphate isomerase [Streptomyces radicis]RKN25214.1 RpiB/LacA/LacB family sugar-phosphate isomerase [Streptomyces radicis]